MQAALIANATDADSGLVGRALRQRGYAFVEFIREQHDQWPSLADIDLVLAMGSSWSVYWDHVSGPVVAEQQLMKEAMSRDIPVLGICFGAQQLSTVLGGSVTKAQSPEIGWFSVHPVPETADIAPKSLFSGPWMQWHYDRFSVPTGATVLADSPVGPQVIVSGCAMGVQFHPEATESIVRTWSGGEGLDELAAVGLSQDVLLAHTTSHLDDAAQRCDALVEWFLADIAQRHIDRRLMR